MSKRLFSTIIFGIVLICGPKADNVRSEVPQLDSPLIPMAAQESLDPDNLPQKVLEQFFGEAKSFNAFQGKVPISKIEIFFGAEANIQELNRRFEEDCLGVSTSKTSTFPCSKAIITLGVLGHTETKALILKFLKKNTGLNPSARKSGLLALGFLENVQQQKIRKAPPVEGAPIAPTAPPSSPTVNVSQEIIKCLPQNLRFSVPLSSGQLQLCDSPWDVKNQNDRDEIRWGLISLAQTGSKDAQEVLENLKDDSAESTSRQAFVRELINLHKNASMENGLLCLNEPENPVCQ